MFIAMNRIACQPDYIERFEEMFRTRAREVDTMPGFHEAKILRPLQEDKPYIIMTIWDKKENFEEWMKSGQFARGHARGFADIEKARQEGKPAPVHSDMELYEVFTN